MNHDYEKRLWGILQKEQLTDLSQFHEPATYDEIPFFSRQSDLIFLGSDEDANEVLLQFALKFLKSVIAYEQHSEGYFAAITFWSSFSRPLIPHLFVWCDGSSGLKQSLVLQAPTRPLSKQVKESLAKLRVGTQFGIREDTSTVEGATRVFVAPKRRPYAGFVPLTAFRKRTRAATR